MQSPLSDYGKPFSGYGAGAAGWGTLRRAANGGDQAQVTEGLRAIGNALLAQIIIFFIVLAIVVFLVISLMSSLAAARHGAFGGF
jgi:hypothetical protein